MEGNECRNKGHENGRGVEGNEGNEYKERVKGWKGMNTRKGWRDGRE